MEAAHQSLSLDQRLAMRLSAQQLRFVRLLSMTAPELEEAIERELEDNPALEVIDRPQKPETHLPVEFGNSGNADSESHNYESLTPNAPDSLYDSLLGQLDELHLSPEVAEAARFIIGSLDTNGYLRRPVELLVNDMAFGPGIEVSSEDMHKALNAVQSLEPAGVGGTDLQHVLLLQLERMAPSPARDVAISIIRDHFDAFTKKHLERLPRPVRDNKENLQQAFELILSLNPKPGAGLDGRAVALDVIVPDVSVTADDEGPGWSISVGSTPELALSQSFAEALNAMSHNAASRQLRKQDEFVATRLNDARDFISVLNQRQEVMRDVMAAILKIQQPYFDSQDVYALKPMRIKDVADLTGLDFSVISRATANKYVALPWGILPLRFFFSLNKGESEPGDTEEPDILTNRKIEAEIANIVGHEDKKHPLSDEKIHKMMAARGYNLARRTVAKYRDKLKIPVARLRKEM